MGFDEKRGRAERRTRQGSVRDGSETAASLGPPRRLRTLVRRRKYFRREEEGEKKERKVFFFFLLLSLVDFSSPSPFFVESGGEYYISNRSKEGEMRPF